MQEQAEHLLVLHLLDRGRELLQLPEEHPELHPQLLQGNVDEQVRLEELGGVQPPLEVDGGGVGGAGPTHGPDEELEVEDGADALDLGPVRATVDLGEAKVQELDDGVGVGKRI